MNLAQLFVRVQADVSGLKRGMAEANASMKGMEATSARLSTAITRMGVAFGAAFSFAAINAGLRRAYEAADALDASNRRLAATAKITGQNLGFLQVSAQKANDQFRIGARLSNEFAIEMTKLASKAGQVDKVTEGIEAFLNLGAGQGLGAEATLRAVQQAILGIDEGTDKLFGKNPSVLYAELAAQIGKSAASLTDGEKALAIFSAGMRDGGKVAGEYAEFLKSPAGQAEQLRIRVEEAAESIGKSMAGIRTASYPVLAGLADFTINLIAKFRTLAVEIEEAWFKLKNADFANAISRGGRQTPQTDAQFKAYVDGLEELNQKRLQILADTDAALNFDPNQNPIQTILDNTTSSATAAAEAVNEYTKALERLDRIVGYRPREMGLTDPSIATPGGRRGVGGLDLRPVTARGEKSPESLAQEIANVALAREAEREAIENLSVAIGSISKAAARGIQGLQSFITSIELFKKGQGGSGLAGGLNVAAGLIGGLSAVGQIGGSMIELGKQIFGQSQATRELIAVMRSNTDRLRDLKLEQSGFKVGQEQVDAAARVASQFNEAFQRNPLLSGVLPGTKLNEILARNGLTLDQFVAIVESTGAQIKDANGKILLPAVAGIAEYLDLFQVSLEKTVSSMTNVPSVFANALRRFQASTAGIGGTGSVGTRPPLPVAPDPIGRDRPTLEISGPVTVVANDPTEFARQMEAYGQRVAMRAGYSTFALAGG